MVRVGSVASRQPAPAGQAGRVDSTMRTPALSVTVEGCWGERGWWVVADSARTAARQLAKTGLDMHPPLQVVSCSWFSLFRKLY